MDYEQIRERAASGATFLDQYAPAQEDGVPWFDPSRIDLDVLEMGSCESCILGQLFEGDFYAGMVALVLRGSPLCRLGFDIREDGMPGFGPSRVEGIREEYEELTTAWTREISRRRAAHNYGEEN